MEGISRQKQKSKWIISNIISFELRQQNHHNYLINNNTNHHIHSSESMDSEIQLHPSDQSHNHSCNNESSVASTSAQNINIQAAAIHVIGDFIQSVGVFIAAVIIYYYVSIKYIIIIKNALASAKS